MAHLGENPFELRQQCALGPAVKYFGNKSAARTQDFRSDRERRLGQRHDPQMVGRGMAGGRRGHVAQHDICRVA